MTLYSLLQGMSSNIQDLTLLGHYAAYSGNSILMFQDSLSVPSSESRIPRISSTSWWKPKMTAATHVTTIHNVVCYLLCTINPLATVFDSHWTS